MLCFHIIKVTQARPSQNSLALPEPSNRKRSPAVEDPALSLLSALDPEIMSHTGFNTIGQDNLQLGNLCSLCQKAFERLNDTIESYARFKVGSEVVPYYQNFNVLKTAVPFVATSFMTKAKKN